MTTHRRRQPARHRLSPLSADSIIFVAGSRPVLASLLGLMLLKPAVWPLTAEAQPYDLDRLCTYAGKVDDDVAVDLINRKGIAFSPTAEAIARLRDAGFSEEVLEAIRSTVAIGLEARWGAPTLTSESQLSGFTFQLVNLRSEPATIESVTLYWETVYSDGSACFDGAGTTSAFEIQFEGAVQRERGRRWLWGNVGHQGQLYPVEAQMVLWEGCGRTLYAVALELPIDESLAPDSTTTMALTFVAPDARETAKPSGATAAPPMSLLSSSGQATFHISGSSPIQASSTTLPGVPMRLRVAASPTTQAPPDWWRSDSVLPGVPRLDEMRMACDGGLYYECARLAMRLEDAEDAEFSELEALHERACQHGVSLGCIGLKALMGQVDREQAPGWSREGTRAE